MSRSYKKHGIIKDGGGGNFYNRIFRHRNNQLIRISVIHQDFDELDLYQINELVNQWDICDYRFRWEGDERELLKFYDRHLRYPCYRRSDPIDLYRRMKREYFNK